MFQEHPFAVWGTHCPCGADVFVHQNSFHPWERADLVIRMRCPKCGRNVAVDQAAASDYYSQKILSYYDDASGEVLDLGCGGGFLTEFLAKKDDVTCVHAIDPDEGCRESIGSLDDPGGKIRFAPADAGAIERLFPPGSLDYLVHRDVFMFIEDPGKYFDDVTRVVRRGIRHMGWYVAGNPRMKNAVKPDAIVAELQKRGWSAEIEYLDWYKCGYFVRADKKAD